MPNTQLKLSDLHGQEHYRIIPSCYPPINFFENIVEPEELETLYQIESRTNDRLREEVGDLFLVAPEDRITGPGASIVMAAFTHIGKPSRFTDGTHGIYYAGLSLKTAIEETKYHRAKFLSNTEETPCEITMRAYKGKVQQALHDVRHTKFQHLHHPDSYIESQLFAENLLSFKPWGIHYNSVRHDSGECIALFRPPATTMPIQTCHLKYVWNGVSITDVFKLVRVD